MDFGTDFATDIFEHVCRFTPVDANTLTPAFLPMDDNNRAAIIEAFDVVCGEE